MPAFDVAIIGGGVIGAAVGRELSRYRLSLVLLEKEAELAFGVSKSNSGIIHPGTQNPPGSLKGRLCVQGNRWLRPLARELGVHIEWVGELIVIFHPGEEPVLHQLLREGRQLGVPGLRMVDRAWLREREPHLNPDALAALYAPTAGIVSPYRLVYALAENAQRNGLEIRTASPVRAIQKLATGFRLTTPREEITTRFVINAAGLAADDVARLAGITDFAITPRKGQEFILDMKRARLTRHLLFPLPTPTSKGVLVIITSDGNPMIGPTAEPAADKQDLATTTDGLQTVLAAVQRLVPSIRASDIIAYFAGLRPVAGPDFIIRHETAVPGMITLAGIQSPGLTAAPAIARMAVTLLGQAGLGLTRRWFFHRYRPATRHLFALAPKQIQRVIAADPEYGDMVCRCEMVSAGEIRDAIRHGARTLDGIKFRTRAQAGRCHGGFCTARIMKILAEETGQSIASLTKRGPGSEVVAALRDKQHPGQPKSSPRPVHATGQNRKTTRRDLVVIGGGPAGMAAALAARNAGVNDILLLERDRFLGGILNQCIHPGFGLHRFSTDLTGPEYAHRDVTQVLAAPEITVRLQSLVVRLSATLELTYLRPGAMETVAARSVILATGCRERTREMIHIPGTRPAGIFPAGLAQKMINLEGWLPGRDVVILGSGDIGLIMARRLSLEGCRVRAVIEIQKQSRGLLRNVVQCLDDFGIPLYLRHTLTAIHGAHRVCGVEVAAVDDDLKPLPDTGFCLPCDTVLVSVGLIPESELLELAGAWPLPADAQDGQTRHPGLFVCGNARQVYDLVDWVSRDSAATGRKAAAYLVGGA